jgi:hypothetical protein
MRLVSFTSGERVPAHWTGSWVDLSAGMKAAEYRKISCPWRELKHGRWAALQILYICFSFTTCATYAAHLILPDFMALMIGQYQFCLISDIMTCQGWKGAGKLCTALSVLSCIRHVDKRPAYTPLRQLSNCSTFAWWRPLVSVATVHTCLIGCNCRIPISQRLQCLFITRANELYADCSRSNVRAHK